MKIGVRHRSVSAWLAILAIALQAAWPLLAQAKPRSVTLVPVCTVGGETHYVELETGGKTDAGHAEHCKACPVGAAMLASPPVALAFSVATSDTVAVTEVLAARSESVLDGRPRAPPSFQWVEVQLDKLRDKLRDKLERNDEEGIALRPRDAARDAAAGRGVLRRGVLLD